MKNRFKTLFVFALGVLCSGVTVYAATQYLSNDIEFTPTNSEWNVNNVSDALNSLYEKTELGNEPLVLNFTPGTNESGYTRFDMRIGLYMYEPYYKYFKIIKAEPIAGSCSGVYFNSDCDKTSGNININQQYNISEFATLFTYLSGSRQCFYWIQIELYN